MKEYIPKIRENFPALNHNMIFFDNAGGTQVTKQVTSRIVDYLINTNVQLGASYNSSVDAGKRVFEARKLWAEAINARYNNEVIFGSSTTALLQNLSKSMVQTFKTGDEVIVTNSDHEANIGPWTTMGNNGIIVKTWKINQESLQLELHDLEKLITDKTKLVAFTHVSNVLGTINPVKEITEFVHKHGAKVCVDGVAYAPHRLIDVQNWNVDYYVFSLYKVYGPHYSLLYGKRDSVAKLPGINHFFIGKEEIPYKLQPGNVNFELTYGCLGILDYFDEVYSMISTNEIPDIHTRIDTVFNYIADYEEEIAQPLIDFLNSNPKTNIIGEKTSDKELRVPTISFMVEGVKSSSIPPQVDPFNIGIRWGDFYAQRLIKDLNMESRDGIVRISMVHYNTLEEVKKLVKVLDSII